MSTRVRPDRRSEYHIPRAVWWGVLGSVKTLLRSVPRAVQVKVIIDEVASLRPDDHLAIDTSPVAPADMPKRDLGAAALVGVLLTAMADLEPSRKQGRYTSQRRVEG